MKRRWLAVAAGALVGAAGLLWWWLGGTSPEKASLRAYRDPAMRVVRASSAAEPRDVDALGVLAWMAEPGIAPRRVAGIVIDEDGAPVEGATVKLSSAAQRDLGAPAPSTVTSADGRFDLGDQPAMSWMVVAHKDGYAPSGRRLKLADPTKAGDDLELTLRGCEVTQAGRITDYEGVPIAGAFVELRWGLDFAHEGPVPALRVGADADGRFELCVRARAAVGGVPWLVGGAPGHGTVMIEAHGRDQMHDIRLGPEAVVEGRVVDERGEAVAGAFVVAWVGIGGMTRSAGHGAPPIQSTIAGSDGRYRLDGLRPGSYKVSASHREHSAAGAREQLAAVGAGETVTRNFVLAANLVVAGTIVAGEERVAGAEIMIDDCVPVVSQADGSFVTWCSPGPEERTVSVRDYEVIQPASAVVDTSVDDVVVRVRAHPVVRGRVVRDGAPAADVTVGTVKDFGEPAGRTFDRFQLEPRAASSDDGAFELRLPPGVHHLGSLDRWSGARSVSVEVVVGPDGAAGVELELTHAGKIRGVVVDARDRPVVGATVYIEADGSDPEFTEADGAFAFVGLAPGSYDVRSLEVRASAVIGPDAPVATVRLAVPGEAGSIGGRIIYDDGTPAAWAAVRACYVATAMADGDGRFVIDGLPPGTCRLRVFTAGGESVERDDAVVGDANVELVVPRTGGIDGSIDAPDGVAVTASALASDVDPVLKLVESEEPVVYTSGGRFAFAGLRPGPYRITAVGKGVSATADVDVRPGETTRVRLGAGQDAALRVRVVGAGGAPVIGARCSTESPLVHRGEPTDGGGIVELRSLAAPAMVFVSCSGPAGMGVAIARLEPGETVEVGVQLVDEEEAGLGMKLDPFELVVIDVADGSSADDAGVRVGDRIVAVDGVAVDAGNRLFVAFYLDTRPRGADVMVEIDRDGERQVVRVIAEG